MTEKSTTKLNLNETDASRDEQTISQLAAQPVFKYYSSLVLLQKVHAGYKSRVRGEQKIDWLQHLIFIHFALVLSLALHPERDTVRVVLNIWYCCWALLTAQHCSLLTLFLYFQVQAPKAIQSSAALLSPLANSPQENSCGSPVQKTSRRSRGFKKTPEKQEWLSASPKQNDNCQVQWLLGCHANIQCFKWYILQNAYTLAF